MKVVLLKDLKGKGKKGDIIEVNSGYATNYLIPNNLAVAGTATNLNEANQAKKSAEYKADQLHKQALELKEKMKDLQIDIAVNCGQNGKIFGSVTNKEIAEVLSSKGFDIDKKKIEISTVKTLGLYTAKIKLHPSVSTDIKVNVIAE